MHYSVRSIAAAAGIFTAALAVPAIASADPDAPVPAPDAPAAPAPEAPTGPLSGATIPGTGAALGPSGLNVLSQRDNTEGTSPNPMQLGLPNNLTGLDRDTLLGQNAVPSAPGAGPGAPPNLNMFNTSYGPWQYQKPSAPGHGVLVGGRDPDNPVPENTDIAPPTWFGHYIDLYRNGNLKGGLLGQMPKEQLSEPMPGTAPPPGTNIPQGLEEFRPDPAPGAPAPASPAPGAPPAG